MFVQHCRLLSYTFIVTTESNNGPGSRGFFTYVASSLLEFIEIQFIGTKESFSVRKWLNSHRTGLKDQHGRLVIGLGHQHGGCDVI